VRRRILTYGEEEHTYAYIVSRDFTAQMY